MAIGRGGGYVGIKSFTKKELVAKFGSIELTKFLIDNGIANSISELSEGQAKTLLQHNSLNEIRQRRIAERIAKAEQGLQRPLSQIAEPHEAKIKINGKGKHTGVINVFESIYFYFTINAFITSYYGILKLSGPKIISVLI